MTPNNHEWKMSKLALLIFIVSLLVSKNSIEGDRNVNHRSLQGGKIQDSQPVNYFGTYLSRDKPINHSGDQGKVKRRSFLNEKRHQQKFFRGLAKIFYSKSLFFQWLNRNLGSRYHPRNYRRPSKRGKRRRPSRKQKRRRPTKKRRRPSKKKKTSRPIRKEKKRRLNVADIMFEIHRSLMPKPDPEIIPTVENREFIQGLLKLTSLHIFPNYK